VIWVLTLVVVILFEIKGVYIDSAGFTPGILETNGRRLS
jgi:hypothetical protein